MWLLDETLELLGVSLNALAVDSGHRIRLRFSLPEAFLFGEPGCISRASN